MNISLPMTNDFWSVYGLQFRQDSHYLVVEGFSRAHSTIRQQKEETEITGCIIESIEDFLAETEEERFDRYAVKEDNPQPGENRRGKKRRRVDILVERTQRPRQKYTFEAKRLERKNNRIDIYTGLARWKNKQELDGMMRFIKGNTYGADAPEAAFIGYIQSDTISYWHAQLQSSLNSEGDLARLNGLDTQAAHCHPHSWSSSHRKSDGSELTLFHLFFDCQ